MDIHVAKMKVGQAVWVFAFFVSGALLHFVCWKWSMRVVYTGGFQDFADAPLAKFAISALGGAFESLFLLRLVKKVPGQVPSRPFYIMGRTGLYGMTASLCAFESFFVLSSVYFATSLSSPVHASNILQLPLLSAFVFIEVQFYGLGIIAACLPFSFGLNLLGGFIIWKAWRQEHSM